MIFPITFFLHLFPKYIEFSPQTPNIDSQRPTINFKRPIFKLSSLNLPITAKIYFKRSQFGSQTPNIHSQRVPKLTIRHTKSTSRGKISTPMDQKIYTQRLRIDYQRPKSNSYMPKIAFQMLKIESHRPKFDFIEKTRSISSKKNTLDFTINTISKSNVKKALSFKVKRDNYCYRENQCI